MPENNEFENLTVLVTGGAGDIGSAVAARLNRSGAKLVLWDRDGHRLSKISDDLQGDVLSDAIDLTDPSAIRTAASHIEERTGGVDILINCVGILGARASVWEMEAENFQRVIDVNLVGVFNALKALVPQLLKKQKEHGRARIVNLASYLGCEPQGYDSAYAASKAGLIALSKSLSRELAGDGLLVNCVAPTVVESRMGLDFSDEVLAEKAKSIPLGRFVETEEIAALIAWLCSKDCSFSTGAVFDITGGRASR